MSFEQSDNESEIPDGTPEYTSIFGIFFCP